MINSIKMHFFLHQDSTCIQVNLDYCKNPLFAWFYHFSLMCLFQTKLAVCSPQVCTWRVATARPAQVPWRELWQLQLARNMLTTAGSFDLPFGSGMITTYVRVLGSLPSKHTTGKEYWHHGQQSLRCKLVDGISSSQQPSYFLVL